MGGNAFATHDPPLPTPRLELAEYRAMRDTLLEQLSEHYDRVAVPLEGPGKDSFGDIDIIVCGPKDPKTSLRTAADEASNHTSEPEQGGDDAKQMPESDAARCSIIESILRPVARNGSSFAVPKAYHLPLSNASPTDPPSSSPLCNEAVYVQVDVSLLPATEFAWHFFMHCHGDLWNMLGPSLRRVGLVLTDLGFCATHPDIEKDDRRRARIVLSEEPDVVLEFLGLDPAVYWGHEQRKEVPLGGECSGAIKVNSEDGRLTGRPFPTEAALFAFVCSSPFFDPSAYARHIGTLKSNDRRRMQLRGVYRRFCEEWVPARYPEISKIADEQAMIDEEEEDGIVRSDDTVSISQNEQKWLRRRQRRDVVSADALAWFVKQEEWDMRERRFREEKEALLTKRWGKETKKAILEEERLYADAWMK